MIRRARLRRTRAEDCLSLARRPGILLLVAVVSCTSDAGPVSGPPPAPRPATFVETGFEGASLARATVVGIDTVELVLREDTNSIERFWFSFRLVSVAGRSLTFRLADVMDLARRESWLHTQPVSSADGGKSWTRVTDTSVVGEDFLFRLTAATDTVRVALKIPYDFSRWLALAAELEEEPLVSSIEVIGRSIEGRDLHLVEFSNGIPTGEEKSGIWVLGRQHPGEPGGSYMVEGLIEWLLSGSPQVGRLLERADVFVIPFMNPDGAVVGNQRTNTAGLDLNRQWNAPDPATAPTIAAAAGRIEAFRQSGREVRILLDFHSAPAERSNFFFYSDATSTTSELHSEITAVIKAAQRINADFVGVTGSIETVVGEGDLAQTWSFRALGAHGLTIESSGNDLSYGPNEGEQQTIGRLLALGAATGMAVAEVLYDVR